MFFLPNIPEFIFLSGWRELALEYNKATDKNQLESLDA